MSARAAIAIALLVAGPAAAQAPAPENPSEQQRLRAVSPGGPLTPGVELPPWRSPANPLETSRPVTDATLASPAAADWLTWRRTQDGLGYSPLDDIDDSNVARLALAWSLAL